MDPQTPVDVDENEAPKKRSRWTLTRGDVLALNPEETTGAPLGHQDADDRSISGEEKCSGAWGGHGRRVSGASGVDGDIAVAIWSCLSSVFVTRAFVGMRGMQFVRHAGRSPSLSGFRSYNAGIGSTRVL